MTTTFSNNIISTDTIPAMEEAPTEAISARYRLCNLALTAGIWALVSIIFTAVRYNPFKAVPEPMQTFFPIVLGVFSFVMAWVFVYHFFADKRIRYALREQDLLLSKGWIFRKKVCQPILRVQHVELKRGPIDRMAGLADLQVFSAGGASHTFSIPGLPQETAEKLRQFILDHKDLNAG